MHSYFKSLSNSHITIFLVFWMAVLILGPYIPLGNLPLRIDHLLFPLFSIVLFFMYIPFLKTLDLENVCLYIKFLTLYLLLLIIPSLLYKAFDLSEVSWLSYLSGIENNLRILVILSAIFMFARSGKKVNFEIIVRVLFHLSVLVGFFGAYQVLQNPEFLHDWIEKLSIDWYSGRHDRARSIVELTVNWRSVSTFYQPGNFALFSIFSLCLFLLQKPKKISSIFYYAGLFIIYFGAYCSFSKGFLGGIIILGFYLIFKRNFKKIGILFCIIILSFVVCIKARPHVNSAYIVLLMPSSIGEYYNKFFGMKFGYVAIDPDADKPKKFSKNEWDRLSFSAKIYNQCRNFILIKRKEAKEIFDQGVLKQDRSFLKKVRPTDSSTGYLSKSINELKKRWILGFGYTSKVRAGDSMIVNLFIRGGIVTLVTFYLFIYFVFVKLKQTTKLIQGNLLVYSKAWNLCLFIFVIFGVTYPTFIQDRTGDVFWIIGGLFLNPQIIGES